MRRLSRLRWLGLSILVLGLDQLSKWAAQHFLAYGVPRPVFPGFNLLLVYNRGAAFSFLSQAGGWPRWFFIGLALAVSAFLIGWMRRLDARDHWTAAALALILGGAWGNALDRLLRGHVIDFIQLYYRHWAWPTFNLADSAITLGAVMLAAALFKPASPRGPRPSRRNKP